MTWTQGICTGCWNERFPATKPTRIGKRTAKASPERCCFCFRLTRAGIYSRIDPKTVRYPRVEREAKVIIWDAPGTDS